MRRLTTLNREALRDEDGATAVVVTLSLVAMFGFGAFAVDVGQVYQERRELQNGADAAVLAAAQDCADPATAATCVPVTVPVAAGECWGMSAAVESRIDAYASANANDGESSACVTDLGSDFITVETETLSGGEGRLTHWFAGVIGIPTSTVTARATAQWGGFGGGNTLPLTFSTCEWANYVGPLTDESGTPVDSFDLATAVSGTIYFHDPKSQNPNQQVEGCESTSNPAGWDSPGGFGWLKSEDCQAYVALIDGEAIVNGDTGNDPECDSASLADLRNTNVLIPIYREVTTQPLEYTIIGFAGFRLEEYRLGTGNKAFASPSPPCGPPQNCISGKFVSYTAYGDEISPDGNDFGATVVVLTE